MKLIPYERSFASIEKSKFWNKEKNGELTPRQLFKSSSIKCWFDCSNCNHPFESLLYNVSNLKNPRWCPYCSTPPKQLCNNESCTICFEKSFASHEKSKFWSNKNTNNPRQVFKSSGNKYWFDCNICNHSFDSAINNINCLNQWCPYCVNQKLCNDDNCKICFEKSFASHEKSQYWNLTKNKNISPRQVFKSSHVDQFWFDCNKCNTPFKLLLYTIHKGCWCPICIRKTELKLYETLILYYPSLLRQFKKEWCKNKSYLPFDFCIPELKIIIELDGPQHFKQIMSWRSPDEQYQIDKYKEKCANENGYSVIRIIQNDVWNNKYDWITELSESIEKIKQCNHTINIYLCKNDEYSNF